MNLVSGRPGFDDGDTARRGHQRAWIGVLVFGFLVITVANLTIIFLPRNDSDKTATVIASVAAVILCFVMVAYGGVAHRNQHVSSDAKGDGIYYLGLLFTFASLVFALIAFVVLDLQPDREVVVEVDSGGEPGGDTQTMYRMIGNFGIALVTTIVGLGGRVFFTMTQDSPGDVATHATQTLEAAINEMTNIVVRGGRSMEDLVGHLKKSADELQKTTEGIATSVEKADSTAAALATYSSKVVKMADTFSASVDDFRTAVERGSDAVAGLENRMAGTDRVLHGFGTALEDAARMLLAVKAAAEEAKTGIFEARDLAVREMTGVTAQVSALGNEAVGVRGEFKKMAAVFSDGAKEATRSLSSVESSAGKAAALEAGLDKTSAAVSALASNVVEAGARMTEATSGIREVGGRATAASEGLEGMKDAAVEAARHLASVSDAAKNVQIQLAGPGSEAAEQMSAAATEANKVASDMNRLADQLNENQEELSSLTRQNKVVSDKLAEHTRTRRRSALLGWLFKRRPQDANRRNE